MQAVVFCRPLFLAGQLEHPHSGRGCPQVSKVNSHIWGVHGGCLSPSSWEAIIQAFWVFFCLFFIFFHCTAWEPGSAYMYTYFSLPLLCCDVSI